MLGLLQESLIGFLGFGLLFMVYKGFEFQWPSQYLSLANTYSLNVVSRLYKILLFRFVPVFVAGVGVWSTAHQVTGVGWFAVLVAGAGNVLSTNVIALVRSFVPGRLSLGINYASYHLTAVLVVALAGLLSVLTGPYLGQFVPQPRDFLNALWTGVFVAIAGSFAMRATGFGQFNVEYEEDYFITRAQRDVGLDFFDYLFKQASKAGADPLRTKAVAIVEVLQRPKWFRTLESLVGRVSHRPGSYGALQVRADKPLGDFESVDHFLLSNTGFVPWSWEEWGVEYDRNSLWGTGGRHHGDKAFIDQLDQIYGRLFSQVEWLKGKTGLVEKRRYATHWGLRFVSQDDVIRVEALAVPSIEALRFGAGSYWSAEIRVPIETRSARVFIDGHEAQEINLVL